MVPMVPGVPGVPGVPMDQNFNFYNPIWLPFDFPKIEEYSIYWETHLNIEKYMYDVSKQDEWLMLISHMECSQTYRNSELEDWMPVLEPSPRTVHSVKTMPDLCAASIRIGLWRNPENTTDDSSCSGVYYWAELLTRALPNPCKGRSISDRLATDIVKYPGVYDCTLRVIFGTFLGVYDATYESPFFVRMMCYTVFALHPPTQEQLARFVKRRKIVTTFCFRAYLLFTIKQTPMHEYLCQMYSWGDICDIVSSGMDEFRKMLHSVAVGPDFLTDAFEWTSIDAHLHDVNNQMKKFVFRPVTIPFYKRVLSDMHDIQRLEIKLGSQNSERRVTSLPVPRLCLEDMRYCLEFKVDPEVHFSRRFIQELTDVRKWGGLSEFPQIEDAFESARASYDGEEKMTGSRRLLYGTESNPMGIYKTHRYAYDRLKDFILACDIRLRTRWGALPVEWRQRQEDALRKRLGLSEISEISDLPSSAGEFFFCPQCGSVRSSPVEWPMGKSQGKRDLARYSSHIKMDLGTMRHTCAAKVSKRRKDQIMRRRKRNARKAQRVERDTDGDDIQVCDGTALLKIDMIGILFCTEADGMLLLCTYCACLMRYTPGCIAREGACCGCILENEKTQSKTVEFDCVICEKKVSAKKSRSYTVLCTPEGIKDVRICKEHRVGFARNKKFMFTLNMLKMCAEKNLRAKMTDDMPFFVPYADLFKLKPK